MDVSASPRPLSSTQRPTQAYYVPRRLLECGRGVQSTQSPKSIDKDDKPTSLTMTSGSRQKTLPKPRPLMEQILAPPPSLKEKQQNNGTKKEQNNTKLYNNRNKNGNQQGQKQQKNEKQQQPTSGRYSPPRRVDNIHLVSSTPSSRSSSSLSSTTTTPQQQHQQQLSPTLTISSPRVLQIKGGPQKYSLPRPNPFAPVVAQSDVNECICDRRNTHVVCKRCGYECVGRVQITCGQHPLVLALNDLRECPNRVCRSIQILEMSSIQHVHDDQIVQQLAEPIEKIDLLADDDQ